MHLRDREIERKTGEGRERREIERKTGEGTQGRERVRKTEGEREGESKRGRDELMERKKNREREGDRGQKRDKENSKRERHRERDPEKAKGRHRRQPVGTAGATGRGHGVALRIPIQAPLLFMGMLTTGKWDSALVLRGPHFPVTFYRQTLCPLLMIFLCPKAWPSCRSLPQPPEASGLCLKT